jgi:hypothetical protein
MGAFILSSSRTRKKWNLVGPFFPGHSVLGTCIGKPAGDFVREECCGGRFYQCEVYTNPAQTGPDQENQSAVEACREAIGKTMKPSGGQGRGL